jgi:hypothetical protein
MTRLKHSDIIGVPGTVIPDFDNITTPYRFNAYVYLDNTKIYMCPGSDNVIRDLNNYNPNCPVGGFILDNSFDEMDDDAFECYLALNSKYTEEVSSQLFQNQIKNKEER